MRLSVCIYTYNHEAYIEQAVTSALNQETDFEYEVIVGDDRSTDSTPEILRGLESKNSGRLRVIYREENIGAELNFENTVNACKGEYVAFLDGDDFWTSRKKLALQAAFLDEHLDASFCFHRSRSLNLADPSNEFIFPPYDPPELSSLDFLLQASNPVALHTVVARRAHLTGLSTWTRDLKLGDWPLCLMLATKGKIGFLPLEMSRYRVHDGGTWLRIDPHLRVAYVIQMLNRVSSLLSGDEKITAARRRAELTDWWANDLICDPDRPLDAVMAGIALLEDEELSAYLLAHVAAALRTRQAAAWHDGQARAWEAAYAKAHDHVSEIQPTAAAQSDHISELTGRYEVLLGSWLRRLLADLRRW
jgi:glycosyltransferase involved in cell wall biosynthesis